MACKADKLFLDSLLSLCAELSRKGSLCLSEETAKSNGRELSCPEETNSKGGLRSRKASFSADLSAETLLLDSEDAVLLRTVERLLAEGESSSVRRRYTALTHSALAEINRKRADFERKIAVGQPNFTHSPEPESPGCFGGSTGFGTPVPGESE